MARRARLNKTTCWEKQQVSCYHLVASTWKSRHHNKATKKSWGPHPPLQQARTETRWPSGEEEPRQESWVPDKKNDNIGPKQNICWLSFQGFRKGRKAGMAMWPESAAKQDVGPDCGYCPGWPFLLSSSGALQLFFLSLTTARRPPGCTLASRSPSLPRLCQHGCLFHAAHLPHPSVLGPSHTGSPIHLFYSFIFTSGDSPVRQPAS